MDGIEHPTRARATGRRLARGAWTAGLLLLVACADATVDGGSTADASAADAQASTDRDLSDARARGDGGSNDGGSNDARPNDAAPSDGGAGDAQSAADGDGPNRDARPADGMPPDAEVVDLPPPAARPPAPPPDGFAVVQAVAGEHPDWLAQSCPERGGDFRFLNEVVRRLRLSDPRWGFVNRNGTLQVDRIAYFWAEGQPEGRAEIYVLDIISRSCGVPGVDDPPGASWGDDTDAGGTWTALSDPDAPRDDMGPAPDQGTPADAGTPPDAGPPLDQGGMGDLPLPDESDVVDALGAERPDLLAASCIPEGGNNDFLIELVRRLRQRDARWGFNWKRGNEGDLSQDVVDYYYGPAPAGGSFEGRIEVYIIDVISGHCGPDPGTTWIDQTEPTREAGSIGRWTLGPLR